ncbi:MAG TPA: GntR family transcriptional regulator [Longimicrobiales bacterium]|nr:GntR family transcriptional regulator [Longimicrobiales bacterium]
MAPRSVPPQRKTVVDLAVQELRERILRGDYPEGSPLRQDALATDLGMSRIPVREALRQLEVEGLVSFNPHAGAVVSSLSLDEIAELFELRALIEADLIRKAIPNLTEETIDRAANILEAYDAAFERGDIAEWGALNWEFHSMLLAAANRPRVLSLLSMLHNQSDRYTRMQLSLTHGESRASDEHKAIAQAAASGDVELAARQMRMHIESAGCSLIDFLREHRNSRDGSGR